MPTENRSSNTEVVSVPLEPTPEMLAAALEVDGIFPRWRAMVAAAPTQQHQVEPAAIVTTDVNDKPVIEFLSHDLKDGTELYTHADPGEVERLRKCIDGMNKAHAKVVESNANLRAQLADLKQRHDGLHRDMATIAGREVPKGCTVADYAAAAIADALSASAEPSVPNDSYEMVEFEKWWHSTKVGERSTFASASSAWLARAALERKPS